MATDMGVAWDRVSAIVEQRLGLHFPAGRLADLRRALRGAAAELGLAGADDCARQLLAERMDPAAMDVVVHHLTIGETYFFRGEEMFAALSKHVLPELIAARRRAGDLRLRLWSAACCTGEEVYSLAILLHRLLPDLAEWQITLLGTDLNPRFLEKAVAATYSQWSFRGTSADFRKRHFERFADGRLRVRPELQRLATFEQLNLVDTPAAVARGAYDLVLCRNVLMYFTPAQATKVIEALRGSLQPEGWLAVAPCEASPVLSSRFETTYCEGAIFYRPRTRADRRPTASRAHSRLSPASAVAPRRIPDQLPVTRASLPAMPAIQVPAAAVAAAGEGAAIAAAADPPPVSDPAAFAARARSLADQRRMTEALACVEAWIAHDKLDPDAHCLRGMILAETGDASAAIAALERCLYLAPDRMMACFALANLERGRGRSAQASRHYAHLLDLLGRLPPEAPVEDAEGVTARQLAALARDYLATVRESA